MIKLAYMQQTVTLYRPVGKNELALIEESGAFNENIVGPIEVIAEFHGE